VEDARRHEKESAWFVARRSPTGGVRFVHDRLLDRLEVVNTPAVMVSSRTVT
jgi:hypothetical protein